MQNHQINRILSFLRENEIRNLSIIGFIENNPISFFIKHGNSVAVKGKSDREWYYFSSNNKNEFAELLSQLEEDAQCFGSVDDWMVEFIAKRGIIDWILPTSIFYLPNEVSVPSNKIEIKKLKEEDVHFIIGQSDYKQFLSAEYIIDRLRKSYSAAIYIDKKPVAWGLTHDDDALGSIHVLDEYRNKGYGKEIVVSLIHQCRSLGKIPFAQIEEQNIPSIKLFTKLGFVKDRNICWVKTSPSIRSPLDKPSQMRVL
jgi:GNAT superfamily N-acetyltransferase